MSHLTAKLAQVDVGAMAGVVAAMLLVLGWLARWWWLERGLRAAVKRQFEKVAGAEYEHPLDEHHTVKAIWQRWVRLRPRLAKHGHTYPPRKLEARIRSRLERS